MQYSMSEISEIFEACGLPTGKETDDISCVHDFPLPNISVHDFPLPNELHTGLENEEVSMS